MTAIDLHDELRFSLRRDGQIRLKIAFDPVARVSQTDLPTDQRNLVVRALTELREFYPDIQLPGCDVLLYKRLPSEAGLGGASSNAAAALLAGRLLWNLPVSNQALLSLAGRLGSDVPFFVCGGAAICRGRGERIEKLRAIGGIPLVVVKPTAGLSTRLVFSRLQFGGQRRSANLILSSYFSGRAECLAKHLFNRLKETAVELEPEIAEISQQFRRTTALGHQMSGSGSSYFGVYRTKREARFSATQLADRLPQAVVYLTQTLGNGALAKPTIRNAAS